MGGPRRLLLVLGCLAGLAFAPLAQAGEWTCDRSVENDWSLNFRGGVEGDEFDRFRDGFNSCFPSSYRGQRTVDLFSNGGSVDAALAISQALLQAGSGARPIVTRVSRGSFCISACTFIFLTGRFRDVLNGGSFEPHGFSSYYGARIDEAIEAIYKDGKFHWDDLSIQLARIQLLGYWLPALAQDDKRFDWTVAWIKDFLNAPRNPKSGLAPGIAVAYAKLTPAQRSFIENTDAILGAVMPELERVAALQAFAPLLAELSGRKARAAPPFEEKVYLNWVTSEFTQAAQAYLRSIKDNRKPTIGDEFLGKVLAVQRERAESARKAVTQQLGPFLAARTDQVDVAGLVTLMFSTSILYTRPLSREEMCDMNIINRDCAN